MIGKEVERLEIPEFHAIRPVIAYRTWKLRNGEFTGIAVPTAWPAPPDENTKVYEAACSTISQELYKQLTNIINSERYPASVKRRVSELRDALQPLPLAHEAPSAGCDCGIYGFNTVDDCSSIGAVKGVCKYFGVLFQHENGVRAQYAEILAIKPNYSFLFPFRTIRTTWTIKRIAKLYNTSYVYTHRGLKKEGKKHGEPLVTSSRGEGFYPRVRHFWKIWAALVFSSYVLDDTLHLIPDIVISIGWFTFMAICWRSLPRQILGAIKKLFRKVRKKLHL